MAINPSKLLPTSALAIRGKEKTVAARPKKGQTLQGQVLIIRTQVIKVEKLISRSYTLKLKEQKEEERERLKTKRAKREEELEEKKAPKEESKGKLPGLPRLGFLDRIKNFIGNMLLAFFAVRLIDHLPKLIPFVTALGNAAEFLINVGGKLLDGLVTFIDWGYKAYDATRGFVKNLFGEDGAKQFDQLSGLLNKFLNLAIIAGVIAATSGGGRGGGAGAGARSRPGQGGRPKVTTSGGRGVGRPDIRNPLRQRPTVTTGSGGKPKFRLPGVGPKVTGSGAKGILSSVRPFLKRIPLPIIGALIDFGLSVALGENPGRAAFRAIGAGLLGAMGAAVGSVVPVAGNFIGGLLGGFAGDAIGGALYDVFFGGKLPSQKGKTAKKAGGGITRGGKTQGSIRRTGGASRGRVKRKLRFAQKPKEVEFEKPGADVGGEKKVFDLFGFVKGTIDKLNPFNIIKKSGEELGKSDYFGPILAISSKITLGQKPTQQDYQKVGMGINLLFAEGMNRGEIVGGIAAAYAEGGVVDKKTLDAISERGDITNWVAASFKDATETNAQKTLREIRERSDKQEKEKREKESPGTSEEGFEVGPAGSSGDKLTMARNLMRDLKLTAAQAAGIVGNMAAESGVENARPQGSPPGTKAPLKVDGVTGYGLVQWTSKGRQQALADFAKSRGADLSKPLSMNIEYQFFLKEFQGAYGNVLKQIRQSRDVKAASTIFMQQYEIPAGYRTEAKIMERYNMSKPIYDKLSRGEGKATEGAGTYIGPSADSISLGKGYGSAGSKIAGELGRFMKQKGIVPGSIHRHPEHPPWSRSSGHSKNSYHYQGRAIDLGAYSYEQGPILSAIAEFNKLKGVKPVELLHARNEPRGHSDHVHVAYEEGGETLNYPHLATIAERGKEFVVDADSTAAIQKTFPGFLDAINKGNYAGSIKALQNYASYEFGSAETVIVQNDNDEGDSYSDPMVAVMGSSGGGGSDSYDPFAMLDRLPG